MTALRFQTGGSSSDIPGLPSGVEKPGSFVRILFINFSSAFNTIQLHLVANKLLKLDANPRLILWIVDFLVDRSQTVHHQTVLSSSCSISTSSPQGTVLSPVLFLLSRVLRHSLPRQSVQQRARFLLSSCETAQTHKGAKTLATSEPSGSMNTSVVKTRGTVGLLRP